MPALHVQGACERVLPYRAGASLLAILEDGGVPLLVGCAGEGTCGLCRVRVDGVAVLACQVYPRSDLQVEVENQDPRAAWRSLSLEGALAWAPRAGGHGRVAALDLGTTRMSMVVADAERGCVRAAWEALNPQRRYGADVITRLTGAAADQGLAERLRDLPREFIAARLQGQDVQRLRIVGNSAMSTLLVGDDPWRLLDPDHWLDATRSATLGADVVGAPADLPPGCGGFVGSDALAAAVHARLRESDRPSLLVDFGTNTEIVLWDGTRCWVTSAAGGPAFEAVGIAAALPADAGGGDMPNALCGSGLVRVLAELLRTGQVRRDGRLTGDGHGLAPRDIHMLARAKAAVGAAVEHLQRSAGVEARTVCVAGRFGVALDPEAAITVGLLPPLDDVRVVPEAALWGALETMLSDAAEAEMAKCRDDARLLDLSTDEAYEATFARHLFFGPT